MGTDAIAWPSIGLASTSSLMAHFDEDVYDVSQTGHLYKFVSALTGGSGAGDLVKQSLIARSLQDIETTWFRDLDALFSTSMGIPRLQEEAYEYNSSDVLTADMLNEMMVKDAWYRARLKNILSGLQEGGTAQGMRLLAQGVCSVDADIYEAWRWRDRDKRPGRIEQHSDREIIIVPHKASVSEREKEVLLHVTDRLKPADSIVTVQTGGLAIHKVVPIRSAASDSSYFEIRKQVTQYVDMSKVPAPEYLADELYEGQRLMYETKTGTTVEAKTAAFSTTQEFSRFYTYDPDNRYQIARAEYLAKEGTTYRAETPYNMIQSGQAFSSWKAVPIADSPDNYPGGRNGVHPMTYPAVNADGSDYVFAYSSQAEFLSEFTRAVEAMGGQVNGSVYRDLVSSTSSSSAFDASSTIASSPAQPGAVVTGVITTERAS